MGFEMGSAQFLAIIFDKKYDYILYQIVSSKKKHRIVLGQACQGKAEALLIQHSDYIVKNDGEKEAPLMRIGRIVMGYMNRRRDAAWAYGSCNRTTVKPIACFSDYRSCSSCRIGYVL